MLGALGGAGLVFGSVITGTTGLGYMILTWVDAKIVSPQPRHIASVTHRRPTQGPKAATVLHFTMSMHGTSQD